MVRLFKISKSATTHRRLTTDPFTHLIGRSKTYLMNWKCRKFLLFGLLYALVFVWIRNSLEILSVSDESNSKPTLVLYVGLHKTGTTFIQCTLCTERTSKVTEPILLQDNWVFLGTCPPCGKPPKHPILPQFLPHKMESFFDGNRDRGLDFPLIRPHSLGERIDQDPVLINERFRMQVTQLYKDRRNGLVVFEDICRWPDQHMAVMRDFLKDMFHVKIIVAYRPIYSWLPSLFNQVSRNDFRDEFVNKDGGKPQIGGLQLEGRTYFAQIYLDIIKYQKHPAHLVRDNFLLHYDDVQVLPQHQLSSNHGKGDPMLTYLFCNLLNGKASRTCQAIHEGKFDFQGEIFDNPTLVEVDADRLATGAFHAGLMPGVDGTAPQRRAQIRQDIAKHWKKLKSEDKDYEWPLECPPPEVAERLILMSVDFERKLFAATWTKDQEEAHEQAARAARKKFCVVDRMQTIEQSEWKSFFAAKYGTPAKLSKKV